MQTSDPQPGLAWLIFSLMTVISWGVYGVLLHSGQVGMSDPINGRYKAFLFVGIAYFLTAVDAPRGALARNGAAGGFPGYGEGGGPARSASCWRSARKDRRRR